MAQYEPQFSQNMFSRVVYNPAFAGSTGRTN
ncbi:MAG TPA: type IX secretion system membrane protein PorP/SprF, partial [Bacteroidales bacterium]|nr:type IX secretion system membrane protein PorP/SprF [Bacteroidales bacterium]